MQRVLVPRTASGMGAVAGALATERWEGDLPTIPGYHVFCHVATGGFGEVFEGEDSLGRRAAIKLSDSPFTSRRLWYEAIAMAAVGPDAVPALYDSGRVTGGRFLAMEWLDAPTLCERVAQIGGPMSLAEFAIVATRMIAGVEQIHEAGFVHRDLKPEHVVLQRSAGRLRVRILDLGLVFPLHGEEPPRVRRANMVLGTSAYMAPEQVQQAPITEKTDIYALGVIMYEMLTGDVPFDGTSTEMQAGHAAVAPPRTFASNRVPASLERVVFRCLDKDPGKRYASARYLRIALSRVLRRCGVHVPAGLPV